MNRFRSILSAALLFATCTGVALAVSTPAVAQADEVFAAPAPAFVATATPEYYEGRPCYYYNGQWYYRQGEHWHYYRSEPAFLRDRRGHWAEGREHEREHGRYHYRR
ncbi:MAG: hypothetical protein ACHREM_05845 [Polyangiales bacterium]